MPIYLTGGGEQQLFRSLDKDFLEQLPKDSRLLLVPLANDDEDFEEVLEIAKDNFEGKKVSEIVLVDDPDAFSERDLEDFDAIYIEGGNTFRLIKAIRKSLFFGFLKNYVESGKTLYADSAGAIVLGQTVRTAFFGDEPDDDLENLQDFRGLGILEDFNIHCHYEPTDSSVIQDLVYETGIPVWALSESTGIKIDKGEVSVFGREPLEIFGFSEKVSYFPGQTFSM